MTRSIFILAMMCLLCVPVFADDAPAAAPPPPAEPSRVVPPPRTPMAVPCIISALRVIEPRLASTLAIRLQLSEETKAKVLNLLTKAGEDLAVKIEVQRKAAEEFAKALTKEGVTADELAAAGEKVMKAETDVLLWKTKTLLDVRAMLTPDQNKMLTDMLRQYVGLWLPPDMRPPTMGLPMPSPAAATAQDQAK